LCRPCVFGYFLELAGIFFFFVLQVNLDLFNLSGTKG